MKEKYRTALVAYIEAETPLEAANKFLDPNIVQTYARVEVQGTKTPCDCINLPLSSFEVTP